MLEGKVIKLSSWGGNQNLAERINISQHNIGVNSNTEETLSPPR